MGRRVVGYDPERSAIIRAFYDEIIGYRLVKDKCFENARSIIRKIPDGRNGQSEPYTIFLPIVNEKWAAKEINGVRSGGLVCFPVKTILYDFDQMGATIFRYEDIAETSRKGSRISVKFRTYQTLDINLNLNIGTQLAKSAFGILAGISAGGSMTNRYAAHEMTKGFIEDSNNEARVMLEFADRIQGFFEAVKPHIEEAPGQL